ncbi:alpha/beta fold hydrolase [Leptothermofonsia sp. ETS-13]|uniref:alpha/beta fold hydrolase n=1 Tax=Leptothermofonsia sp. ETS-13 TaxID=3035696 RepID=UPI003B9FF1EB
MKSDGLGRLTLNVHFDAQPPVPLSAAYREAGSGPTLLMLHGFLGTGLCWMPLIEKLQTDFRCVSLDLLGFGESPKPMIRYDVAKEVAFVRAFIQTLKLEPCAILGHSFGGWVAAAYALAYPESVNSLVLAAAAGIRDDSFCGRYDHLRPLLWETPIIDWGLGLAKSVAGLLGQASTLQTIAHFRQELIANPAACSFLRDRIRPEDAIDTVEKAIHQLQMPVLVITGDRDETIPLWHSETYAREIPNAQLEIIPGADHALPQNHASELASLILRFFHSHLQLDVAY